MKTESHTPRTDRAGEDGLYSTMVIHALRLELELNEVTAERDNLNASLTAAISSSNARHFESMEYEAKSKQLEIKLNEVIKQRDDLMTMLEKIAGIAEQVDSWESFPSDPIEQAYDLMQSIKQTNKIK